MRMHSGRVEMEVLLTGNKPCKKNAVKVRYKLQRYFSSVILQVLTF